MEDFNQYLDKFWDLAQVQIPMIIWAIITVFAVIAELNTMALVSIWFVVGGLVAFFAALFHVPVLWQFVLFVSTSVLTGIIMSPFIRKLNKNYTPTNTDSLIGHEGITESELDLITGSGRAMIEGQSWAARSVTGSNIPANTVIVIERIEGVTLYVRPKE